MAKNEKSAAAEKIEKAEKTKAKRAKSDKPNIFIRIFKAIGRFFKDLRGETKKIVWPDAKSVLKSTGVVLAVVAVFTVVIWLIDLGLSKSIDLLSDAVRGADEAVTETVEDVTGENLLIEDDTQAATEAAVEAETEAETAAETTAAAE